MELGNANAVQSSVVSINANNGLAFSNSMIGGDSYNIDGLAGSGNLALSDTGGSAVTLVLGGVGSNNQNPTTGMNYGGNLSGPGAFTHNNGTTAGTLSAYQPTVIQILSGSNSYTGQTTLGAASAGSILEFANKTSLYGGVTSKWNGSNIVVKTGNVLAVLLGTSPGQFGTSDLNTLLSDVETTSTSYAGFESGSVIGIDTGAGNFTYSNAIVNPSYPTATLGVTKLGSGNFTFNAANTYTGITTVDNGTLTIGAGGSLNGGSGVPLVMGGGTLALNNGSSQTFTTLAVNPGGSTFNVAASNTLGFTGAITRAAGSALNFTGAGTTNVLAASTYNGIIGGYALYGGTAFAINTAGTVGALTTYSNNLSITPSAIVDTSTGNNDVLSTSGTLSANTTINSLTITDGASGDGDTLNLNGYSLIFSQGASANQVGGILYNPGTTGNLFLITCSNGLITSGSANALQNTAQGELVVNVTPGNTLKISGNYGNSSTGGGGLTVGGGGTVQLIVSNGNGSNGTRGAIYVDYGTLQVGDGGASASLSDSAQVYIATTGTLAFDEKTNSALSMVNLVDNGMIICEQTTVATNTFNLGNTNNSGGSITGIGAFTQASGVTFSNFVGAYTGPTTITSGTLVLQNEFSVENSVVSINVNAGLAFNNLLAGNAYTIGGLSGSHNLALTDINGSPVSLTIGNNNNTGMTYSGSITGSGSLTKIGTGTQTISAGTYTGALGVQAGTLIVSGALSGVTSVSVTGGDLEVDGSVNGSAKINLSNGGELSGQGTVGTIIDPSSTLAPGLTAAGTTAGTLTTSGTVQLASTTNFDIRLGVVSSTDSDQLKTTSGAATTISLSGANLVLTLGNNFNATPGGNVFYQIINGGAGSNQVSGQFAEGTSQFTSGGSTFEIFYNVDNTDTGSGTGSYVDLELISVPEPSTWAMFIAGAGMLVCGQRARRRLIK
jgi:autotransporter-associated beta strand protein